MKRTMFYLQAVLLLIIAGLITGCAGGRKGYVEPSSGPTASIRFVASSLSSDKEGNAFVIVSIIEGVCVNENIRRVGALHGLDDPIFIRHNMKRILGMPLRDNLSEKDFTEIKVPAGPFSFDMHSRLRYKSGGAASQVQHCNDTVEFEAVAGRLYEAEFVLDPKGCAITVNELVEKSVGEYVRQPEKTARTRTDKCNWQ